MSATALARSLCLVAAYAGLLACTAAEAPAPDGARTDAQAACAPLSTAPSADQRQRVEVALAALREGRVPGGESAYASPPGAALRAPGEPREIGFVALDGMSAWVGEILPGAGARQDASMRDAPVRRVSLVWDEAREPARLAHIHISEPTSLGAALAAIAPEPQGDAASPLVDDVEGFWSAWTDTDMERVTANYVEDGTTLVILPWVPDAFQGWPAFREAAQGVINGMERFGMAPAGSPRAWQSTGAALTVGTWRADLESTDGAQTQGDARYTLLWRRCQDGWRVQHEHLSSWAAQPPNANGDPE